MDESAQAIDPDYLMDLDEAEGSDLDDDEDELIDDHLPSPFQFPSSGSAATSAASSPPNTDDFPLPFGFSGKPFSSIRRGRGRPRREGMERHFESETLTRLTGMLTGKPAQRRQASGNRIRKVKPSGCGRKKIKSQDRMDFDLSCVTPSPSDELSLVDPDTGALIFTEKEKPALIFEELPYFPEQWPGKVCAFCNLGERSQLGQGDMLRLICPEGFTPQRVTADVVENFSNIIPTPEREGDKSPRGPVTCRRQKSFNKCRHPSLTSEYVDELTIIGYTEEPHISILFDSSGYFYTHRSCAVWSHGVTKNENSALENVGPAVLQSSSRKCSFCNHYGASVLCKMEGCTKVFHFPCGTASGAFQLLNALRLFCSNHIGQASLECENAVCYTCKTLGDIANLMYCSSCGEHYHGICVGLAQLPGVRAGWQCRKCRICQVCRMTGDESKLMTCEQCDKIYHSTCQRPIVTSIPKYGWKCRCCRVCGDCGSRTPGAGLSSRWHAHYTVCDSCYQQRNKGFSCPLCHRAYRAHAHREMVQCTLCRKFVHGTCDPEADLVTYHQKKEGHPEYEYVCLMCKNLTQPASLLSKRNSTDDSNECVTPQESPYDEGPEFDTPYPVDAARNMGLGKGKPYSASKIAKKRLGLGGVGSSGRPKGVGKGIPGKVGFMKRQRMTDFGRKRGAKAKMRGVFGVPGVGLQRPVSDGKNDEEPGVENRLVLCSAKDKFVLTQDICVMCGALGTDQEGCLISCVQCGQCYHPYCVNVKVTKVILQKGWRCLDCTVCEGCGQRNDEARLILCDDCDISYHIYCMDPPLDYVPHGNWKCKWCAVCQTCGATDPGFNCTWMNSFTECGPCASHVTCPGCSEPYSEGDLIIQCVQCERWLHGTCDSIKTEDDAEKCAEEGYNCLLCRPRDVPPPHLIPTATALKPPTPTKSPEVKSNNNYYVDGVYLSENGFNLIKSLSLEQHGTRKKRKKITTVQDKEAGIMATIESVVAGGSSENMLEDSAKLELVDVKDEPQEIYKEGMMWMKEDGPPPDGFTVFTMENGVSVLRRKRQRNLQKLGIGGFLVRMRGIRGGQDNDDIDVLPGQSNPPISDGTLPSISMEGDKPRRKPVRRKPKSKIAESFPPYLQEAFFGKDLMDSTKEIDSSSSDEEKGYSEIGKTIQLTQDEIKAVAAVSAKHDIGTPTESKHVSEKSMGSRLPVVPKEEEEEEENTEDLKDVLAIPGDLLDTDLVNTIMNEGDSELHKNTESLDALAATNLADDSDIATSLTGASTSKDTKDELTDILGPNFNLETMPSINSKDVEDIFKGVLTDDSQESQESNVFPIQTSNTFNAATPQAISQHPVPASPIRLAGLPAVNQSNINSPLNFPPPSPYQSEYSNSPQFSPAFSEPPSPWVSVSDTADIDAAPAGTQSTYNQRSSEKMKADEGLGNGATISAVLYANMNHPEWKTEFPNWSDRYKQILKKWRTLSSDQKAPYLQQARDNRSALRMKKQQQSQINKETSGATPATTTKAPPPPPPPAAAPVSNNVIPSTQVPAIVAPVSEDQEKVAMQHKSAREAEQERQWKQLQASRQQQAQHQQNIIQEQRVQSRVQRQISDPTPFPFSQEQTPQEISPVTSPTNPRQILSMGIKSPTFTHPTQPTLRPLPPAPLEFTPDTDPYTKPPSTPKLPQPTFQTRLPADPYAHQPSTPRPQFHVRANLQNAQVRPAEGPEMNRQLRDLLQRQQFKKLDDQLLAGKGQQRVWPPAETTQEVETPIVSSNPVSTGDATFRQPLPPSIVRPRIPVPVTGMPRQPGAHLGLRMQLDPRVQGLDPRMRLLLQQQQQQRMLQQSPTVGQPPQPQMFPGGTVRFSAGVVRPASVEQYEQLLPKQQAAFQPRAAESQISPRMPTPNQIPTIQRPQLSQTPAVPITTNNPETAATDQEIPDNVTAELEKLEQETGTMAELQGVGDILGGLGDDDDELLAEMGPDFNILEYADPEALPGEKTNILDLELEEEPIKNDKKVKVELPKAPAQPAVGPQLKKEVAAAQATSVISAPQTLPNNIHPPPLAISQAQSNHPLGPGLTTHLTPQQIHQQMLHQVQQAAANGKPMPPGSRLQTPDGIIGIVTPNNTVHLQLPQGYHQRLLVSQLQSQKLQMRLGQNGPRIMSVAPVQQQTLHTVPVGLNPGPRLTAPPPPPPPYPGPPPPYPGSTTPQQQEQPLLLEDLLEQEKREQEKQNQTNQTVGNNQDIVASTASTQAQESTSLLSDQDFERITDVLGAPVGINANARQAQVTSTSTSTTWQQTQNRPKPTPTPQPTAEIRVQTFSANLLTPPPLPPENIVTEQDKQKQLLYEQWLSHQNNTLTQQLKYYETEVNKLRKMRKSLNSKQRQLRKTGGQLADADANELQRIAAEQSILQKHLESSRKLSRQHGLLIQEYRTKQQAKQRPGPGQSPLLIQQNHSPLGPPSSSPIHHSNASQSPMMSPSASPLTQHNSPLHSPSPMISHSPGPGSVNNILQSPNGMSPMQPSPRIGTPHSQGDSSPGPAPSPSQVCLPPPAPRMTSPQHKRVVTSPVGYTGDLRPGTPQMRFVRTPLDHGGGLQRRLPSPMNVYQQKPGTPSPLSSPPPQQLNINQQLIQKQLQQQNLEGQETILNSARAAQLIQQRNLARQQQQQQQIVAQPAPLTPQQHQMMIQQQQQLAKQQQQIQAQIQAQLQAQQQRLNQQQNSAPASPMPPKSPLISQQIMSPHSMPPSPMPPRSPMMNFANQQTPNSPVARNANFHQPPSSPMTPHSQYQPPSSPMPRSPMIQSPMGMRRPPSSPAMPDRPTSVDNVHSRQFVSQSSLDGSMMDQSGGGNPHNPNNPIPIPPRFGYFKLGLRGGTPMWSFGRGAKRIPTPPVPNKELEKANVGECSNPIKPKKESHLSKVSILKRKSPAKTNLQQSLAVSKVGSLVSTDYNEFDDSSCTPPVTPPPAALTSTSRIATVQKTIGKKIPEVLEGREVLIVHSPDEKQLRCDDIMDYDDDNNTVISGEVSLSSAAQQNDGDDIAVIESLAQSDLVEPMSSPLESDQIADEYVLFPGNMVDLSGDGEAHYSDKEEVEEEEYGSENMHVVIRSPTTSDDEFIMQNKTKKYNIRRLPSNHLLETADSPEPEEMQTDPSPEAGDEDAISNYEESEIVIIDPSVKSPEEQISTKEDFEELIDEGSRKDKIMKQEVITAKHINEIHKYAANVYSFPPKADSNVPNANTGRVNLKLGPKFSLITPVVTISRSEPAKTTEVLVAQNSKLVNTTTTSKLTNIILHSAVRTNVLSVPKLVTSGSSAITIVSANPSPIASILPSGFTVPVISASAVRQLPNVKVIDKPSSSISLTTHDTCLPKKIFEDDSVSPDSSNCEDDKSKDSSDEKSKTDSPPADFVKQSPFIKVNENLKSDLTVTPESSKPSVEEVPKTVAESVTNTRDIKSVKEEMEVNRNVDSEKKPENLHVTNIKVHNPRVPSPIISKTSSPVIIHNTPELKMTAQVIQESQSGIQITARAETVDGFEGASGDDTKSVVISIPSPTPSQEQMLDNIALQALENRRRDGNGMPSEFESFEDVLDMIENITGKPPTVLEDNIKDKLLNDATDFQKSAKVTTTEQSSEVVTTKVETKVSSTKPSVVPQLSPLSQPTDLTTNMANASQQLRTLLSLATTATTNNAESVVKTVTPKVVSTGSILPPTPVVSSRVIHQGTTTVSLNTVIVPNMKQKTIVPTVSPIRTQATTVQSPTVVPNTTNVQITTSGLNFLPARSTGIQLMPEHPKLPRVTAINAITTAVNLTPPASTIQKSTVIISTTAPTEPVETTPRKTTCSLTEMLQSHPAAVPTTKTSADTITAASLLGTSIALSRSGFSTSLVQAQPHVVVSAVTTTNSVFQTTSFGVHSTSSITTSPVFKSVTSSTNLLHTQLTKVIRHKSLEETLSDTPKVEEIKSEPMDTSEDKPSKLEQSGCKFSTIQAPSVAKNEDSQNALLKKLLQNTACANTQTPSPTSTPAAITVAASTQFNPSLESQLKASILSPVVKETPPVQPPTKPPQKAPIMSRETSFVSSPVIQQPQTSTTGATQQLHIDIKKCLPPSRTPSRDDLLSPPTPRSSCSQDSSLQTPPLIKKEITQPLQQQISQEVKKEFVDETSQHSEVSDQSRSDVPMKEELDSLDPITEKMLLDKEELKKQKRRMYQQKRRQNQIMNKEAVGQQPKKRPRKSSKVDEDYDTYVEGVLAQLRTLPPMIVSEPVLNRNFNILPVFGSDLSKLAANDYDSRFGELKGDYGNAYLPGFSDFYNTQPYGDHEPMPEKPPASTQRGFYDQEFPLIKFDSEEDKRFDMFCREDSPDSIISSSSPECPVIEPRHKFLGLKLINEDDDDDDEDMSKMRLSPVVPIVAPIPIRLKPAGPYLRDYTEDKENVGRDVCLKPKFAPTSATPLKDSGNVTVTLTLTSSAAEDIMGVLRDLANILHIPAPTSYQIVERTSTPPSQKLGLYRTKGKDGKEGAPIDIQSILNGAAKFCKHCDVVILNNMIRKKVSELPFLSKDSELLSDGDELFFCSTTCYMQFALMHRSPSIPEDKAAAIIDHLCHKDKTDLKTKRPIIDSMDHKKSFTDPIDMELRHFKREAEPMDANEIRAYSLFTKQADAIRLKKYDELHMQSTPKVWKGMRYKSWTPGCLQPPTKHKKPTDKETMELLYRMGITVTPIRLPEDFRKCMFCRGIGDGVADGPARLLNFDVDKWVHLNCGLWSDGVYETVNGALMNLENALQQSLTQVCVHCSKLGATIRCFKTRCSNVYHLTCAVKDGCVFYKNKTTYCTVHIPKNEKDNELTTLSVSRRVYVNRDENRQVAAVMHHSDTNNLLRVGSLIFLSVGQLLPHQLQNFHNQNYIYPIGYKIIRFYWSMRHLNKRCKYICSIHESFGKPEFRVVIQEGVEEDVEFKDISPKAVWHRILDQIASMRRENQCVQVFPQFVSGEDLFGLTEPAVVRVLESLPGIETLTDYKFKYGRNPLLELPLAINPSGAARTEPRSRSQLHWKRPHTQRTAGSSVRPLFGPTPALTNNNTLGEGTCPYTKQFVHSKSSQYKKMKQEWRNNVYLARSKIQGLGLYAARDLEKHTMVIEYIGEIIRTELAETREKKYEAKNRGIYMFRLDEERVVDATLCGGLARYINHSCNPNCVAETVEVDRDYRIIIFAKRRIQRGEELAYDYKFDIEDDQHKISCMCGAPNCRKWMN